MIQDERWKTRYEEVMEFMELNHRNPSKHRIEEHDMLNWVKQERIDENQPWQVFGVDGGGEIPRLRSG